MLRNLRYSVLGLLLAALMAWAACGGGDTADSPEPAAETSAGTQAAAPPAASGEPIRIGLIHPHTGPLAGLGEDMTKGWEHYWNQQGMQIAGRPIELFIEDTEGQADVGLDKIKKLVEQDKVHIVAGPISSGVAYGIGGYAKASGIPLFITQATANLLTQADDNRAPNIFRTAFSSDQLHLPIGPYLYDDLGYRKVLVMAQDYAAGWEHAAAVVHSFEQAGGEAQTIFPPLGETELAPYLTEVLDQSDEIDALVGIMWGASAVPFINQAYDFGIRDQVEVVTINSAVEDQLELPQENPPAVEGIINWGGWCLCLDDAVNEEFKTSYEESYGKLPHYYTAMGQSNAEAIGEALKAVNGNIEDTEAFLEAARNVRFVGPRGPFYFDGHQNAVINVYLRVVEEDPDTGEMRNVLLDTYEDIGQYWPASVGSYDDPVPAGFPLNEQ